LILTGLNLESAGSTLTADFDLLIVHHGVVNGTLDAGGSRVWIPAKVKWFVV